MLSSSELVPSPMTSDTLFDDSPFHDALISCSIATLCWAGITLRVGYSDEARLAMLLAVASVALCYSCLIGMIFFNVARPTSIDSLTWNVMELYFVWLYQLSEATVNKKSTEWNGANTSPVGSSGLSRISGRAIIIFRAPKAQGELMICLPSSVEIGFSLVLFRLSEFQGIEWKEAYIFTFADGQGVVIGLLLWISSEPIDYYNGLASLRFALTQCYFYLCQWTTLWLLAMARWI